MNKTITIYVKGIHNDSIVLKLNTKNWEPDFSNKNIYLDWDYDDLILKKNDIIEVKLILIIDSNIWYQFPRIYSYSFDTIISADPIDYN